MALFWLLCYNHNEHFCTHVWYLCKNTFRMDSRKWICWATWNMRFKKFSGSYFCFRLWSSLQIPVPWSIWDGASASSLEPLRNMVWYLLFLLLEITTNLEAQNNTNLPSYSSKMGLTRLKSGCHQGSHPSGGCWGACFLAFSSSRGCLDSLARGPFLAVIPPHLCLCCYIFFSLWFPCLPLLGSLWLCWAHSDNLG